MVATRTKGCTWHHILASKPCFRVEDVNTQFPQAIVGPISIIAQGPHSHVLVTDRTGPKDFLDLKFWPKGFFGVYEKRRDFWGREKKNTGIFLGFVFFISSNQQSQKRNLLMVWEFFGYAKISIGIFLGTQILKLGCFWV